MTKSICDITCSSAVDHWLAAEFADDPEADADFAQTVEVLAGAMPDDRCAWEGPFRGRKRFIVLRRKGNRVVVERVLTEIEALRGMPAPTAIANMRETGDAGDASPRGFEWTADVLATFMVIDWDGPGAARCVRVYVGRLS